MVKEIAEKLGISEETEGDLGYSVKLAEAGAKAVAEQLDAQTPGHGLIGRPGEYMILDPLEMERSGCDYLRPRLDENSAVLYKKENGVMTGCKDYYDNAFVLGGAGSMKSTISDMKKILYMYLNHGKTAAGGRILSMEGIRSMCRPRMEYRPESWYCFGLATKKIDDVTVVEHGGKPYRRFLQHVLVL